MDVWMNAISEFGFPAAISFYLLHRIERKLDILNTSIQAHHFDCKTKEHPPDSHSVEHDVEKPPFFQ